MFKHLKLLFTLIFILYFYTCDSKYCGGQNCSATKSHNDNNLCKLQSYDPARHCVEYQKTIHTVAEKQAILDKLNSRRNKIATGEIRSLPAASNMMKLEWDTDLEMSAQRWANQCVKHNVPDIRDTCRDLGKNTSVGQTIATIYGESPGLTPLALVDVWYMELLNINSSVITQYQPSADIGYSHYDYFTQLVWAETSLVGCGGVKFKDRERNSTIYRLVCNFAPEGNQRSSVYAEGAPCTRCVRAGCDARYTALCYSNDTIQALKPVDDLQWTRTDAKLLQGNTTTYDNDIGISNTTPHEANDFLTETTPYDEEITPFDYFSHLHEFTTQMLSTTVKPASSCKDILAVEDFVELLKKKLSTDPMFKDLMLTTKMPFHTDASYTDASVAALVSRLYSKMLPSTTPKFAESENVNSTFLVDLVESVIFRKGVLDKSRISGAMEYRTEPEFDVSPVRIQAELAEVKKNEDFTGHYFFPEDDDNQEEVNTESYYELSSPLLSDVVFEIDDIRRNKATRDFVDEILESDPASESTTTITYLSPEDINLYKNGKSSMKKFLAEIADKKVESF